MASSKELPAWALEAATAEDRERTSAARREGAMQITWPDKKALRAWTRQHGWPAPRFGFEWKVHRYDARQRRQLRAGAAEKRR